MESRCILRPSILTPMLNMGERIQFEPNLRRARTCEPFRNANIAPSTNIKEPISKQESCSVIIQNLTLLDSTSFEKDAVNIGEAPRRNIMHLTKGGFRPKSRGPLSTIARSDITPSSTAAVYSTYHNVTLQSEPSNSKIEPHHLPDEGKVIPDMLLEPHVTKHRLGLAGKKLPQFRNLRFVRAVSALRQQMRSPEWNHRSPGTGHRPPNEPRRPAHPHLIAVPTPGSPGASAGQHSTAPTAPDSVVAQRSAAADAPDPRAARSISPAAAHPTLPTDIARRPAARSRANDLEGAAARPATAAALASLLSGGGGDGGIRSDLPPAILLLGGQPADAGLPPEPYLSYLRARHPDAAAGQPDAAAAAAAEEEEAARRPRSPPGSGVAEARAE